MASKVQVPHPPTAKIVTPVKNKCSLKRNKLKFKVLSVAKCRGSWVVRRGRGSWVSVAGRGCGCG